VENTVVTLLVYISRPFGAIVAVVWYGAIEHKWRNECGTIDIICFISHFVGASFGGIAELYAQPESDRRNRKSFGLLDETPEKINLNRDLANRKIKGNVTFNNAFSYPSRKKSKY
jgi:hypothetical protein